jgi:hypothetical protein
MSAIASKPIVEPTIACPHCGRPVPLTEALAAPLIAATRAEFEQKLRDREQQYATQEVELAAKQKSITQAAKELEEREAEARRKSEAAEAEFSARSEALEAEIIRRTNASVEVLLAERLAKEKNPSRNTKRDGLQIASQTKSQNATEIIKI